MSDTFKIIGQNIRQLRQRNNHTLESMANKLEISFSYLSRLERGIANPTIAYLNNLAEFFKVRTKDLFSDSYIPYYNNTKKTKYEYTRDEIELYSDDLKGYYTTYGISYYVLEQGKVSFHGAILDVSTDKELVDDMVTKFNQHQLHSIHIYEAVEDHLI